MEKVSPGLACLLLVWVLGAQEYSLGVFCPQLAVKEKLEPKWGERPTRKERENI